MQRPPRRVWLWPCALILFGCSSNTFASSSSGGSQDASTAGTGGADASAGGSAATGGSGGTSTGGSAGDAGNTKCDPTQDQACAPGSYCNSDKSVCVPCSDLGRLHFAEAKPLTAPNAFADASANGLDLAFPRSTGGTGLVYSVVPALYKGQLYYTPDFSQTAGTALGIAGLPANGQSGPVYSEHPISIAGQDYNLVFDQVTPTDAGGGIHLLGAVFQTASGKLAKVSALPPPFNDLTKSSYDAAVAPLAPGAARGWWMMGSGLSFNLVTAKLGDASAAPINLTVDSGCPANFLLGNPAPWVSPDGSLLLFRSVEHDSSCKGVSASTDLYSVPLDPATGTPKGNATPLDVNLPRVTDTDASLSPDMCWLYFASNRETSQSKMRLYRAHRD